MSSNQHFVTRDNIRMLSNHHLINLLNAGSITFDDIFMTFDHIFDRNVRKRLPDMERLEVVSLQDKVVKEQRQTERHKTACETWQARHKYELEKNLGDGERVLTLEGGVKRKTRELFTLGKNVETIRSAHVEEIKQRDLQAQVSPFLLCVHFYLLFVVSNFF